MDQCLSPLLCLLSLCHRNSYFVRPLDTPKLSASLYFVSSLHLLAVDTYPKLRNQDELGCIQDDEDTVCCRLVRRHSQRLYRRRRFMMRESSLENNEAIQFIVTGKAAHQRLKPLLPNNWRDVSSSSERPTALAPSDTDDSNNTKLSLFLWENAPRRETKNVRDRVKCYSHLPNGTDILDSKWVLARLFQNDSDGESQRDSCGMLYKEPLATLETHCFRGRSGFARLCRERLGLLTEPKKTSVDSGNASYAYRDLLPQHDIDIVQGSNGDRQEAPNMWVVKDAAANGAGGVWVVAEQNVLTFLNPTTTPLLEEHRYVAQRYAWPPVLYGGRKCHVRVYGLITSDGRAFVHERCFLHVANDPFAAQASESPENDAENTDTNHSMQTSSFQDSVHITNCCANSHDASKFAGEICASLKRRKWESNPSASNGLTSQEPEVPLAAFAPSIYASVAALAKRTFPYLQGGAPNHGFEYLGMDFILSMGPLGSGDSVETPTAYLLEVNAPPSQDTATGLPHAESLHDTVIADILSLWVYPKLLGKREDARGWHCVFQDESQSSDPNGPSPSKAALSNKFRWAMVERKALRQELPIVHNAIQSTPDEEVEHITRYARAQFPFFQHVDGTCAIFLESAGGSQVPAFVIDRMSMSLQNRHRSIIGSRTKTKAKSVMHTILGASRTEYDLIFGANATSLLDQVARQYVRRGLLVKGDEIVISVENHVANVRPWLEAAEVTGAVVRWWHGGDSDLDSLRVLLNGRTRVCAFSHASNILGEIRDIRGMTQLVKKLSGGRAHVCIDGVAACPHVSPDVENAGVDFYAISCHKLFGPHLGVLCGRKLILEELGNNNNPLELGTVSYEACAGIEGLGEYFARIGNGDSDELCSLTLKVVREAYGKIRSVEKLLCRILHEGFARSSKVRVISSSGGSLKVPVFSITHNGLSCGDIVGACDKAGITCRSGCFLSCSKFQDLYQIDPTNGVVRFSFAHYNTPSEAKKLIVILESIPGWF